MWFITSRNILQKQTNKRNQIGKKKEFLRIHWVGFVLGQLSQVGTMSPRIPLPVWFWVRVDQEKDMGGRVGRPKWGSSHCTWKVTYTATDLLEGAVKTACLQAVFLRAGHGALPALTASATSASLNQGQACARLKGWRHQLFLQVTFTVGVSHGGNQVQVPVCSCFPPVCIQLFFLTAY